MRTTAACADQRELPSLQRREDHWIGRFVAMGCPCEVLVDFAAESAATQVLNAVAECAWRIERKFSRYRTDSVVQEINQLAGKPLVVDDETANLLDFAATVTELSAGAFDITSGVLRRAWTFDGGNRVPAQRQIDSLLSLVGWHRVEWHRPVLRLEPGMQIDLGGIGKEYAADAAAACAEAVAPGLSCLVNFGGDIVASNPRKGDAVWHVGVERADSPDHASQVVQLSQGALATSGDSRRFVLRDGHRYTHILDARTGWPVRDAPHSVTVAAKTCTQAGTLTTLAMLQGPNAEQFLRHQGVRFWLQ